MESHNCSVEENRKRVLEYLRDPNLKQCYDTYKDGTGASCALSHIFDALDVPFVADVDEETGQLSIEYGQDKHARLEKMLNIKYSFRIGAWNDIKQLTLPQIADRLEQAFITGKF